jgi:D-serine deaminase-like pyridoxal phosphate-dependent protein
MHVLDLDTPAIAVDRTKMMSNLTRAHAFADGIGVALRPHIKTHKIPELARLQVELGAAGITCQKLGEAEVMADAGLTDILIPYNLIGSAKLDRLDALARRVDVIVSADSAETVQGYATRFGDPGRPLPVLIECDTGGGRCGVQSPAAMLDLARKIDAAPGLDFAGVFTYPPRGRVDAVEAWLAQARALAERSGLPLRIVSNGGSPDFYRVDKVRSATEHRPGTYIYSDRMQVSFGHGTLEDCALTVVATVVSRPTAERAVLDAGSKALAADTCALPGHGHIIDYPEAVITTLNEEHGIVDLSGCAHKPRIGERVRVIPNHVCVVSNLFDEVHLTEDGQVVGTLKIAARGLLR